MLEDAQKTTRREVSTLELELEEARKRAEKFARDAVESSGARAKDKEASEAELERLRSAALANEQEEIQRRRQEQEEQARQLQVLEAECQGAQKQANALKGELEAVRAQVRAKEEREVKEAEEAEEAAQRREQRGQTKSLKECKHKCANKAICAHACCKRHLDRYEDVRKNEDVGSTADHNDELVKFLKDHEDELVAGFSAVSINSRNA